MGLDGVELIMDVEKRFDIRLTDEEVGNIRTVGELTDLVCSHLNRYHRSFHPLDPQAVLDEIRELTSEQLGVALDRVRPESNFVRDLGMT